MLTPRQVLDQAFLDVRSMLLEIAATLDRFDDAKRRHEESNIPDEEDDGRLALIRRALDILSQEPGERYRTEQLLDLFSVAAD